MIIDNASTKTKSKRNSRATNHTNRFAEQQKNKNNNQNGTTKESNKLEQSTNKVRVGEDGSTLGVYMTMDELTELVKAVKENSKSKI